MKKSPSRRNAAPKLDLSSKRATAEQRPPTESQPIRQKKQIAGVTS